MPSPRRTLISIEDTPYYHCCSRVVRRAYLCGDDKYTGKNYDHRRGWVEAQILKLSDVFAIDVAAYAVMSNHLHIVLYIDLDKANVWSDREVVEQWHQCFNGTALTQKFAQGEVIDEHQVGQLKHLIATYRSRLSDISWFMRNLNEFIARKANAEDNCTGRFWEGRFKSQALLDETRLVLAENLLKSHQHNLNYISSCLGFTEPRSFYRWFNKLTEQTPGDFRKMTMH